MLASCSSIRETGVSEDGTTRQVSVPVVGEVEVPVDPERVVLLRAMDAGNAFLLDANVIGVNESVADSDYINSDEHQDVEYLEYGDIDSLRELDPDLIVTFSGDENVEEYQDIAPTIPLNYQTDSSNKFRERIYLNQLLFLGVVLNREDEAEQLGYDWLDHMASYRQDLNMETNEVDALVLTQEESQDEFYVYGPYQSYASEVVYDVLNFNTSDSAEEIIAEGPVTEWEIEDFNNVEADYVFISMHNRENQENLKREFADTLGIQEGHVILLDYENYMPNDLHSIEQQTENIIDELN